MYLGLALLERRESAGRLGEPAEGVGVKGDRNLCSGLYTELGPKPRLIISSDIPVSPRGEDITEFGISELEPFGVCIGTCVNLFCLFSQRLNCLCARSSATLNAYSTSRSIFGGHCGGGVGLILIYTYTYALHNIHAQPIPITFSIMPDLK